MDQDLKRRMLEAGLDAEVRIAERREIQQAEEAAAKLLAQSMNGAKLIAAERERQVVKEGYTPAHDDEHNEQELLEAAMAYIKYTKDKPFASNASSIYKEDRDLDWNAYVHKLGWPWEVYNFADNPESWGEKDPVRNLVKAGALIAAEIDRLQRLDD